MASNRIVKIGKEVLDDIASRFFINLPEKEKTEVYKVCDHLEIAHWFYLDFLRPEDPSLPACSFEEFLATIFDHCSYEVPGNQKLDQLIQQWKKSHKYMKPVRGAILLNKECTKCVLVQGYPASSSWGFPKGKMNEGESDSDAAVREVYEEVGFDIRTLINEKQYIEVQQRNGQTAGMFIIPGISEDTEFVPQCRKEIKAIQWFHISDLPSNRRDNVSRSNLKISNNKFFLIIPFISKLKKKIAQMKTNSMDDVNHHDNSYDGNQSSAPHPSLTNPYYEYYSSVIVPSKAWNSFEIDVTSVMNKFRERAV